MTAPNGTASRLGHIVKYQGRVGLIIGESDTHPDGSPVMTAAVPAEVDNQGNVVVAAVPSAPEKCYEVAWFTDVAHGVNGHLLAS